MCCYSTNEEHKYTLYNHDINKQLRLLVLHVSYVPFAFAFAFWIYIVLILFFILPERTTDPSGIIIETNNPTTNHHIFGDGCRH